MKLIRLKHCMDTKHRVVSLNEAFKEALSLSNGCSCAQEEFETELLNFLNKHEDLIHQIKDSYKENILKSWDYEFDYNAWVDRIEKVELASDKYPLVVDVTFIVRLVTEIHSNERDFEEGDLLERIYDYSDYNFVLYEVDLKDIAYSHYYIDDDTVDEYMEKPMDTMPPIILDTPLTEDNEPLDLFLLIDGAHRCTTLEKLGISKIKAYIPTPVGIK